MKQKLQKILENPFVRLAGASLVVLIACLAWLYPRNNDYRSINTSLMTSAQLFSKEKDERLQPLSASYYGKIIENLNYGKIRFQNNGTIPIERKDYVKNITIRLPEDVEVITFKTSVHNAIANVELIHPHELSLNTDLFNPGLIFDLDFIFTRTNQNAKTLTIKDIEYDFTIYGITKIPLTTEKILTEEEEREEAKNDLHEIWRQFRPILIFMLATAVLIFLISLYQKLFPEKKSIDNKGRFSGSMVKAIGSILPLSVLAIIIIFFLYRIIKLIYIALR